ncbi:MAG TPA: hypothetical protein V6C81_07900 [Planktothrix sp.]|jgi:hypothetical protein
MKDAMYERKGLNEDQYSHHWFVSMLRHSRQLLAEQELEQAESTVGYACLFALERMNSDALAAGLGVLAEILEEKGMSFQDYLERGKAA